MLDPSEKSCSDQIWIPNVAAGQSAIVRGETCTPVRVVAVYKGLRGWHLFPWEGASCMDGEQLPGEGAG
jgi:hypothetical protein